MEPPDPYTFTVGRLVKVEARTWPGINKHGGIGRITRVVLAVATSTTCTADGEALPKTTTTTSAVDVQYVLGGREKGVPIQYVHIAEDYETRVADRAPIVGLRDRGMLLGRCKHCGSLRADCGSCDWHYQQQDETKGATGTANPNTGNKITAVTTSRGPNRRARSSVAQHQSMRDENDSLSSSSDDSLLLPLSHWKKRQDATNRKFKRLERQINRDSDMESSSSSSSSEEEFLSALRTSRSLRRNLALLNRLERSTAPKKKTKKAPKKPPPSRAQPRPTTMNVREDSKEPQNRQEAAPIGYRVNDNDEEFPTVDDDDIGDADMTQTFSLTPLPRPLVSSLSNPVRTGSGAAQSSAFPEQQVEGSQGGIMLVDNDLGGFIQPEGAATSLPRGAENKTSNLGFADLPAFFDSTMHQIHTALPGAHISFANIQRRVETRKAVPGSNLTDLEKEGWDLYDSTKRDLLVDGLDQCRAMFRRLNSRKEFKKQESNLSDWQKRLFGESARNTRDIRFDQADQDVEYFLRETRRYLLYELKSSRDEELYGEVDDSSEDGDQSYQVNMENAHHQQPLPNSDSETQTLSPFDPHMHASRRRHKVKRFRRSEKAEKRKQRRRVSQHRHDNTSGEDSDRSFIVDPVREKRKQRSKAEHCDERPKRALNRTRRSSRKRQEKDGTSFRNSETSGAVLDCSTIDEQVSFVPSLYTLFAPMPTEAPVRSSQSSNNRMNSVSAGERMQAFLDANGPTVHDTLETTDQLRIRHLRGSRDASIGEEETQSGEAISRYNCQITVPYRPTDRELFLSLANSDKNESCIIGSAADRILSSLQVLRSRFQLLLHEDEVLLRVIEKCKADENISSISRDDAVSIFSLAHMYLLKNAITLQELVATNDLRLSSHSEILVALLILLETNVQEPLEQRDDVIFSLFSGPQPCPFVQVIILQLMDVLLAFFNPHAWAMEGRLPEVDILSAFSLLRDSLSSVVPLLEISCEYLFSRVDCQRWWKSEDGAECFVSSVNPSSYKTTLETAKVPKAANVRMKQFNSKMPRVEVRALWSIVGFLAGANVQIPTLKSKGRWRLLYTILCGETGVLPKSLDVAGVWSASEAHIERCENELNYVALLVARGAMNPLDDTDKLIGLFLKRSIQLQAHAGGFEKFVKLLNLGERSLQKEFVLSQWEASALRSSDTTVKAPANFDILKDFSPAGLLGKAIYLLESWVRQTEEKQVLWTQLASSINKLLDLERLISNSGNNKAANDGFADAFAASEPSSTDFMRDASVHVLTLFDVIRTKCAKTRKKPIITIDMLTKRWAQTSNLEMKFHQNNLAVKSTTNGDRRAHNIPLMQCFTAIRTFCIYSLSHIRLSTCGVDPCATLDGQPENAQRQFAAPHQYVLHFAMSCIFASLKCMCSSILNTAPGRSKDDVKILAVSLAMTHQICISCRYCQSLNDDLSSKHLSNEVKNVGRSILELGGQALRDCLITTLSLAGCEGAQNCVRMCMATIRCVAAWAAETLAKEQITITDDEFGDIDDSLFLTIGSSNENRDTAAEILCRTIRRLLELGDPNNIYAIQSTFELVGEFDSLDSRGLILLSRCAGGLCSCLSSLVAASQELRDARNLSIGSTMGESASVSYRRNWSFTFLSETCKLSKNYAPCRTFVEQRYDTIILSFLHMSLDAYTIERFPTCDLDTMMTLSGEEATRREGKQLKLINDISDGGVGIKRDEQIDEVGPVYASNNLWRLYQHLRTATMGASPFCDFFASSDDSAVLSVADGLIPVSMELECLRRMRLLLGFFDMHAAVQATQTFENVLLATMKTMLSNLLQISEGLQYHACHQARSTEEKSTFLSHKHGRLNILQTCYVEMFVSLFSSVVLSNWETFSDSFRDELKSLREVLFFSMAKAEENDIEGSIRRFVGNPTPTNRSRNKEIDAAKLDLRLCINFACIRRVRQTIRHHLACGSIADRQRGVISLVASISCLTNEAGISYDEFIHTIAKGFRTSFQPDLNSNTSRPLIEYYVDSVIFRWPKSVNSEGADAQRELEDAGIRNLRRFLLTKVIPPRLLREHQISHRTKASLMELTNSLLHIELDELKTTTRLTVNALLEMHELLRSTWEVMRHSLSPVNGSVDLLSLTLRCASLVIVLPFSSTEDDPLRPLLGWCQSFQNKSGQSSSSKLEMFSHYLSTFVTVMLHIARTLLHTNSEARRDSFDYILKSAAQPRPKVERIDSSLQGAARVTSTVSRLLWLNDSLLADTKESFSAPRNVYTNRPKAPRRAIASKLFEPAAQVKREAANFIAVVDATNFCFEFRC